MTGTIPLQNKQTNKQNKAKQNKKTKTKQTNKQNKKQKQNKQKKNPKTKKKKKKKKQTEKKHTMRLFLLEIQSLEEMHALNAFINFASQWLSTSPNSMISFKLYVQTPFFSIFITLHSLFSCCVLVGLQPLYYCVFVSEINRNWNLSRQEYIKELVWSPGMRVKLTSQGDLSFHNIFI